MIRYDADRLPILLAWLLQQYARSFIMAPILYCACKFVPVTAKAG